MTGSMRWISTYREQYERECRYLFILNAVELASLVVIVAALGAVLGA